MHSAVKSPVHLPFGVTSHIAVLNEPIVAKGDIETVIVHLLLISVQLCNFSKF